jgi:hypothetical protein
MRAIHTIVIAVTVTLLTASVAFAQDEVHKKLAAQPEVPQSGCVKLAYVIDGGDHDDAGIAKTLHATMNGMEASLDGLGFTTTHFSNYEKAPEDFIDRAQLLNILETTIRKMKPTSTEDHRCYELMLVIHTHGVRSELDWVEGGFSLEPPGGASEFVMFADVYMAMLQGTDREHVPVAITMLFDTCYAGQALQGRNTTWTLDTLGTLVHGTTVMTGTDATSTNWAGNGAFDSASQDFLEGYGTDVDGDGVEGSLSDMWQSMSNQSGGTAEIDFEGITSCFWDWIP